MRRAFNESAAPSIFPSDPRTDRRAGTPTNRRFETEVSKRQKRKGMRAAVTHGAWQSRRTSVVCETHRGRRGRGTYKQTYALRFAPQNFGSASLTSIRGCYSHSPYRSVRSAPPSPFCCSDANEYRADPPPPLPPILRIDANAHRECEPQRSQRMRAHRHRLRQRWACAEANTSNGRGHSAATAPFAQTTPPSLLCRCRRCCYRRRRTACCRIVEREISERERCTESRRATHPNH